MNAFKRIVLSYFLLSGLAFSESARPNIVVILADDLGYMDPSCYAALTKNVSRKETFIETPHIDELADLGMLFTDAYAASVCSPSRASLLTGKHPLKVGFTTATGTSSGTYFSKGLTPPPGVSQHEEAPRTKDASHFGVARAGITHALDLNEKILPEVLSDYHSCFLGKWHIGADGEKGYQPPDRGFDEVPAFYDKGWTPHKGWRRLWDEPGTDDTGKVWLADDLTVRANRYIENRVRNHPDVPFLLYVSHFAPHGPFQANAEDIDYFENHPNRGWNGHSNAVYAALIKSLDDSVGSIVEKLSTEGVADNTLVIFMSDNGGVLKKVQEKATDNAPLRYGKAALYEGGVRVPLIMKWPQMIKSGLLCDVPVHCSDILPTCVDVAQEENALPAFDGTSLVPLFTDPHNNKDGFAEDVVVNSWPFNSPLGTTFSEPVPACSSIRKGDYKLIWNHQGYVELYDLKNDISESTNIVVSNIPKTIELFGLLNTWMDKNVKDRYRPPVNEAYSCAENSPFGPFNCLTNSFRLIPPSCGDYPNPPTPKDVVITEKTSSSVSLSWSSGSTLFNKRIEGVDLVLDDDEKGMWADHFPTYIQWIDPSGDTHTIPFYCGPDKVRYNIYVNDEKVLETTEPKATLSGLSDKEEVKLYITAETTFADYVSKSSQVLMLDMSKPLNGIGNSTSASVSKTGHPTEVLVDVRNSGYQEKGVWKESGLKGYDGANTRWTGSNPKFGAVFTPSLSGAGSYEVFTYKVVHPKNDNGQTFIISHNGETTTVAVDFTKGESGWVSLGQFYFNAVGNEAVEVKASKARGNIRASSVKWRPVTK